MAELPKIVRQRLAGTAADGTHIDANLLAAFSEGTLMKAEREVVLAHLATCAHCREIAALATPEPEAASGLTIAASAERRGFARLFAWRWSVVAITACLVVGSAVMLRLRSPRSPVEQQEIARVQPQAPPATQGEAANSGKQKSQATAGDRDALIASKPQAVTKTEARAAEQRITTRERTKETSSPMLAKQASRADQYKFGGFGPVQQQKQATQRAENDRLEAFAKLNKPASSPVPASPPPPPPAAAKSGPVSTAPAPAYVDNNATDKVASSSETVNVMASPTAVPEAKANAGAAGGIVAGRVSPSTQAVQVQQEPVATKKASIIAVNARNLVLRWTIAADGTLQRSADNGQSWQPVALAEGKPFRVVANAGPLVWVGGTSGALFRSMDAGEHWIRIQPATPQQQLTGDVTTIRLAGPANQIVRLETSGGQKWISNDGGKSWQLE